MSKKGQVPTICTKLQKAFINKSYFLTFHDLTWLDSQVKSSHYDFWKSQVKSFWWLFKFWKVKSSHFGDFKSKVKSSQVILEPVYLDFQFSQYLQQVHQSRECFRRQGWPHWEEGTERNGLSLIPSYLSISIGTCPFDLCHLIYNL